MGEQCDVHICDFSLARRETHDTLLTQNMVTRWYRPPEILLCKQQYNTAVDVWSAGCVFAELIMPPSSHRRGLFSGATYRDQTDKIIEVRVLCHTWPAGCALQLLCTRLIAVRCLDRPRRTT